MQDTNRLNIVRIDGRAVTQIEDEVVVEEPLEVRVNHQSIGVTMRTPGDDFDLALGLLWTEGIVRSIDEVGTVAYCPNEDEPDLRNVINVTLVDAAGRFEPSRRTWASSSCGLCGKSTLESVYRNVTVNQTSTAVASGILAEFPDRMRQAQTNFNRTGGIHAAALFDSSGRLALIREDLGRHNAVDKALGGALQKGLSVSDKVLMVSGRLGFEIAQKAAVAGIPIVASVSAPSSLAVELAAACGITAIGFVRDRSMNVYCHPQRVV